VSDDARRSAGWFADDGKNGFIARHHMRQIGLAREDLARPIIGIANSWSELTPCNAHLRAVAEHVKRGVTASGGTALEFPVMSLGEPLMRPTTMFYRNLMAMEVEETVRANPLDAVVLLGGCDKTTPALLMGAASVDIPTIVLTGGPMLNGRYRGTRVGSGTDIWRMSEGRRSGTVTDRDFDEFEACLARSAGHCMTMGTASTMACLVEAMGLQLPGAASLPAVDARRSVLARQTGARAVALAEGEALEPPHSECLRKRYRGQRGHRWIDERRAAPTRHRGPCWSATGPGRLRPSRGRHPSARGPHAQWPFLDGGVR